MAKRKAQHAVTSSGPEKQPEVVPSKHGSQMRFFPFANYTSTVGVYTTLLLFNALFIPRAALPFIPPPDPSTLTSSDKPQHPFLNPLTINPVSTLVCICIGTVA